LDCILYSSLTKELKNNNFNFNKGIKQKLMMSMISWYIQTLPIKIFLPNMVILAQLLVANLVLKVNILLLLEQVEKEEFGRWEIIKAKTLVNK
jgi:hypothetical protein